MKHWNDVFPHEKPRACQVEAIDFALRELVDNNKKFVIIEAGTGVGKSAIGITIARYLKNFKKESGETYSPGAYFLTTQKLLQEQYTKDFGRLNGKMKSIKSSTNYQCGFHKKNTCAESMRALRGEDKSSRFFKACVFNCVYKNEKEEFLKSTESVTNFPYFLAETSYSGKITPREVLVIDEAHNAANELSKFVEIVVTEKFSKNILKSEIPDIKTQSQAYRWIKEEYSKKLFSHVKHIEKMIEKFTGLKDKIHEFASLAKQLDLLDKHACKLNRFLELYNKDNWICNIIPADGRSSKKIEFKPVDVSHYAGEMLFKHGKKIILMSATILQRKAFCNMLGIQENDASFISIPSPFPIKNRPIVYCGIGGMSAREIDTTLPKLAAGIKKILDNHPGKKGIIHCHTFKIAKYLKKNIRSSRLLIHDSSNRESVLERHKRSSKPTVLLSPSMTEGVDLRGDCSRFQVICKVPYPYLGDKLIRKKMNKWGWWYPLTTAKTIVQSVGRSIRDENDHAVTYILDSDWEKFYSRNYHYFPESFKQCLR